MPSDDLQYKLEELLHSSDVPSDIISEVFEMIGAHSGVSQPTSAPSSLEGAQIRAQLAGETDWRKRASLAAKLISLSFED